MKDSAKDQAVADHGAAAGGEAAALPVLMTTAEVAGLLRVDPSTLSKWRSCGAGAAGDLVDAKYPQVRPLGRTRLAGSGRRVTIRKLPSGRFQAIVKAGRAQVCSKSFATRREAQAYYAREKAALAAESTRGPAGQASAPSCPSGLRSASIWCHRRRTSPCCPCPARTPVPRRDADRRGDRSGDHPRPGRVEPTRLRGSVRPTHQELVVVLLRLGGPRTADHR